MIRSDFQLRGVGDPRLAVHATSPLATWLWSTDGARVLWANPVGAKLFGAANSAALADRVFGPADSHRRQIARLARQLPAGGSVRLERLRGFGARLGTLMTCACARLDFADGSHAVLVTAMDPALRTMPLVERLHRLVAGAKVPMAAFAPDGLFVGASEAARTLLGFRDLFEAGLERARSDALREGRAATQIGIGQMVLQRVGRGADIGLVALIEPAANPAAARDAAPAAAPDVAHSQPAQPSHELAPAAPAAAAPAEAPPAPSTRAPSDIALFDAFAEPEETAAPAETIAHAQPDSEAAAPVASAAPEAPVENIPIENTSTENTPVENRSAAIVSPQGESITGGMVEPSSGKPSSGQQEPPAPRQHPLRFLWQMDAEGRFVLLSDEFIGLIGPRTAAGFGRPWREIAADFALDPDGRVAQALQSQDTWAGITVSWPADGGERLPVELAGLPVYDEMRNFAGFRGFGVCRDLDALNRLEALRRFERLAAAPTQHGLSADVAGPATETETEAEPHMKPEAAAAPPPIEPEPGPTSGPEAPESEAPEPELPKPELPEPELPEPTSDATSHPTDLDTHVETPPNVVPFRPPGDTRAPTLTPVENSAFNELARQLSERLERERETIAADASEPAAEIAAEPAAPEPEAPQAAAEWLSEPAPPPRGTSTRDRTLLDLLPSGILIYRLDRLLYANPAFLARMGYASVSALENAGGLDALYVEPGVSSASSTSQAGTPVTISATVATGEAPLATTDAHLHAIDWDGESAHALICALPQPTPIVAESVVAEAVVAESIVAEIAEPAAGEAEAEDLAAILDTTAEGIVMFDAEGNIHACNRSAEALFGYDGEALLQQNLMTLFAPESQQVVADYLQSLKSQDIASLLDHGREVLGREKKGGAIPLAMIMGRTRPDGPNFFAVFRDLSQAKKGESELTQARRLVDGAANAKADMLARISHEIRTPLNAIIGFAEVMISERFGTLGNERYGEYMKDIRASGERVIAIIDDLLELSRIETGQLDLNFADLNLNDLVEACVTVMQPQANRERIIIRTSLAHALPQVSADARAMRQITMNLISNSIRLASAGGQVIVSTALTDRGEIALRIRDTGHGLSEREVAAAMEPFRTPPPGDAADSSALSLSLTKALVEANRARFNIKNAGHGTLIEVVFAPVLAKA